jgi:hypothetical protein
MRRTVWMVVFGLLVLAVIAQSIALVERRSPDEPFGERSRSAMRVYATQPRNAQMAESEREGARKKPTTSRTSSKPASADRGDILWWGQVESRPKVKSEAYNDALDRARMLVAEKLDLSRAPSREFVNKYIKADHCEKEGPSDSVIGDTFRVSMDLEVTRDVYRQLAKMDRDARVEERVGGLARVMAVVTALLGCIAGYIRLDEWTKGYYTWRLRLLTLVVAFFAFVGVIATVD